MTSRDPSTASPPSDASEAAEPASQASNANALPVRNFLASLQDRVCDALEAQETSGARFAREEMERPGGGVSRPRVLSDGAVIERAAVNFTHTEGAAMPASASERRPELAGRRYEAVSVSLIVHPRNPYAPTCHANFRHFLAHAREPADAPVWWFGGGFDLTPYYPFDEDVLHWHRTAHAACAGFGGDLYARFKSACDEYFFLPHRDETRGVGGVFFDDWDSGGFDASFGLVQSLGQAFLDAYVPILERRKDTPYGERERAFQCMRRGRYVEFNLLYDRGTRFGLQAGARAESVLASLPPRVEWHYDWRPEPGSAEECLADYLRPRDWLGELTP